MARAGLAEGTACAKAQRQQLGEGWWVQFSLVGVPGRGACVGGGGAVWEAPVNLEVSRATGLATGIWGIVLGVVIRKK